MNASPDHSDRQSLRVMMDLAVCFVITVCMLRGFFLEGYLVSTGSMAPVLLGFHKRVNCPTCEHAFAFGVRFDESVVERSPSAQSTPTGEAYVTCPNCGQVNIDISTVPRNHGDQLLVHKHIFDLRSPHRWEPVVFRNQSGPSEAYVKRVVGLAGEELHVVAGDIYIDGQIVRKSFETQVDMRIPVSDLSHVPDDDDWELPWQLDGGWDVINGQMTTVTDDPSDSEVEYSITLRPWRWSGGRHLVEVPLSKEDAMPDWSDFARRYNQIPISWTTRLAWDEDTERLSCEGVMPAEMQHDLMRSANSDGFRRAVYRLAALSHMAPVTDRYGYNSVAMSAENFVRDLMLDAELELDEFPTDITLHIPIVGETVAVSIEPRSGRVVAMMGGQQEILREGQLPTGGRRLHIQASNFDRRLVLAVNGELVFAPIDFPGEQPSAADPMAPPTAEETYEYLQAQSQLGVTVTSGCCRLSGLRLFRDVYYTRGRARYGIDAAVRIPAGHYFVLGDNSPVSFDSRSWQQPFVPHRLLVGKPFVVHLPSRPGVLSLGGRELTIRLPDFHRIRYIP